MLVALIIATFLLGIFCGANGIVALVIYIEDRADRKAQQESLTEDRTLTRPSILSYDK